MTTITYHKYGTPFGTEYNCKSGLLHTCWNLRNAKARAAIEHADELIIITTGVQHPKTTRYLWSHGEYRVCT